MKLKFWPTSKIMQFSTIAFIVCNIAGLVSMGLLGSALFFVAAPMLELFLPKMPTDLNTLSGDWIWPTMIAMPLLWSFGWLIAGRCYAYVDALDWTNLTKKTGYAVILLVWNLLIWLLLLAIIRPEIS